MFRSLNCKGQGLVEYLVLLCLVAVTTIGVVSVVGQNIKQQYERASYAIRGEDTHSVKFDRANDEQTKRRGMNDWDLGAK